MTHQVHRTVGLTGACGLALVTMMRGALAFGAIVPAEGFIYSTQLLASQTQSCVAVGPGGTFVGLGPSFTANAEAVVLVQESGAARLVAFGFNSIGDCVYDAQRDILYVSDNADAGDIAGAVTGDTVFAFPSASTVSGMTAHGHELVPANSVPFAASLALDAHGDVYVSDSVGNSAGRVLKIAISGPTISTFASPFDYTAGLAFDTSTGNLLVAETRASFDNQIRRFNASGTELALFAGPSFAFGSYDLAYLRDGRLVATGLFGGDVVAFNAVGAASPFASGLNFANAVTVNAFTGRVEILSGFSGTNEDRSLHRFTPIDRLVRGHGPTAAECVHEFYGVQLAGSRGAASRAASCVDGDACDADGTVNDSCLFPIGFCLNVADPGLPDCSTASQISTFSLATTPASPALAAAAGAVRAALPIADSTCFFSDGFTVPVKSTGIGKTVGTAKVKVTAQTADGREDKDTIQLRCVPAS